MAAVIYPRGFVGFDIGAPQNKKTVTDFLETVRGLEFNRAIQKNVNLYPSNPEIDALWREYTGGTGRTSAFAFRERILLAALKAFGTKNFTDWVELQKSNPYIGPIHKKFLNDTFEFIKSGKRSVSITSWQGLVRISTIGKVTGDVQIDNIKDIFTCGVDSTESGEKQLTEIIQVWVSKENGFDDLLGTLVVLFGLIA